MKWLGLIGGTSWHSTALYYRDLNEKACAHFGGATSAQIILVSLNYEEVLRNQSGGDLTRNDYLIVGAAHRLKQAGAEGIVLCANTMHFFADQIEAETGLPVIHIARATALAIQQRELRKVALLGTKFTMEMPFIRDKLTEAGLEWLIPGDQDRDYIHGTIVNEMGKGVFNDAMRAEYLRIIQDLIDQGAEGVILGCTEIPMLLKPEEIPIPSFDTTALHTAAAFEFLAT